MPKTTTMNLRIDPELKRNAEHILQQLGIPMATAVDMYLRQIVIRGGIPFSLTVPSATAVVQDDFDLTGETQEDSN